MVPGITYVPDYLTDTEHDQFIAVVDQSAWLRSLDHDAQVYGYSYSHRLRAATHIGELPDWATGLARRLREDGHIEALPNQLVVNSYKPGEGFWDHIDHAVFGETVVSLSLGSPCIMQFSHERPARSEGLLLEPKSLLVMSGQGRWEWKHGIPPRTSDVWQGREYTRARRVSLTFRGRSRVTWRSGHWADSRRGLTTACSRRRLRR